MQYGAPGFSFMDTQSFSASLDSNRLSKVSIAWTFNDDPIDLFLNLEQRVMPGTMLQGLSHHASHPTTPCRALILPLSNTQDLCSAVWTHQVSHLLLTPIGPQVAIAWAFNEGPIDLFLNLGQGRVLLGTMLQEWSTMSIAPQPLAFSILVLQALLLLHTT